MILKEGRDLMQEPKIHSSLDPFLPDGHWLLEFLEPHGEDQQPMILCRHCGFKVYTEAEGTVLTWVETGFMTRDHVTDTSPEGEPEVGVWCLFCFAHKDDKVGTSHKQPVMSPEFALNDDGTPQPLVEPANGG